MCRFPAGFYWIASDFRSGADLKAFSNSLLTVPLCRGAVLPEAGLPRQDTGIATARMPPPGCQPLTTSLRPNPLQPSPRRSQPLTTLGAFGASAMPSAAGYAPTTAVVNLGLPSRLGPKLLTDRFTASIW